MPVSVAREHVRMSQGKCLRIGLWGGNGHQIHQKLDKYPRLKLMAYGAFDPVTAAELREKSPEALECSSYEELLAVQGLEFVSLCSPLRSEQAQHAISALKAGIHVYAEKPCATTETDLDLILAAAEKSSATFHEMAGTVCEQPKASRALRFLSAAGCVTGATGRSSVPHCSSGT